MSRTKKVLSPFESRQHAQRRDKGKYVQCWVEPNRYQTWRKAYDKCCRRNPDLTFSDWLRFALDTQAEVDLRSKS